MKKKILWLDTETTGLNPNIHGLREVGFIVEIDGVVMEKGVFYINPFTYEKQIEIDDYALFISNKTIEELKTYDRSSLSLKEFIKTIVKYINVNSKEDVFTIAGYNVGFDIGFIKAWFDDIGPKDAYKTLFNYKALDVFSLVFFLRNLDLIDTENDKLETLCKYFNIDIDAHNALSDILATKQLYETIVDKYIIKNNGEKR